MTVYLTDMLKRVPLLALVPFIAWALGMTVYAASWKTQMEYQMQRVMAETEGLSRQADRVLALEQNISFLREDVTEIKQLLRSAAAGGK